MAAPPSRLERLVKVIGEQNLPAKLPQPAQPVNQSVSNTEANESDTPADPFSKLQSVDNFIQEQNSENWWDFNLTIPQPVKQVPSVQVPTAAPAPYNRGMTFEFDSRVGQPAPLGISFTPFLAVTRFPYVKSMGRMVDCDLRLHVATS